MSIQEQGRLRATLQRKYQMSPGGVERWAKERERKRKARRELAAALARVNQGGRAA